MNYKSKIYEEKYSEYASYLKNRQFNKGIVPVNMVESLSDESILDS